MRGLGNNVFLFVGAAALIGSVGAGVSRADEGMARITEFSTTGGLLAENKVKARPKAEPRKYKTVDEDSSYRPSHNYFKGSPIPYTNEVFVGLGVDYFSSFGLQARYASRVVEKLIPDLNNSLYVEGGLGVTFYGTKDGTSGVTGFSFVITGRWDFQVNEKWILFGDLGFGFNAVSGGKGKDVSGGNFFPAVGVGAMYNFSDVWALRGDLSYQFLGIGITHRF